jgi:signal transduction histidine kinase
MASSTFSGLLGSGQRREALIDVGLATAACAGALALLSHGTVGGPAPARRELDLLAVLLAAASSLPLLWWRRSPLGVFVMTTVASAVAMALGYPGAPPIGATIALYLLAASRDELHPWTPATRSVVVGLFAVHITAYGVGHGTVPQVQLVVASLVWALAWFAGERTRLRRQEVADLQRRATTAERDAERDRRLAIAEERARIARDLHDSAAHAINVIAVQAGAARLLQERDPAGAEQALHTVEDVARDTVAEIDKLVHSLRDPGRPAVVEPAPGLAALRTLVAQHAAAGLVVTVTTDGSARPVRPAVDQAAYRILQEALTNCARHGAGPAHVAVSFGEDALALTVANPASAARAPRPNGGHGLVGMRERATLLGGAIRTEHADGVFRVSVELPYGAGGPALQPAPAASSGGRSDPPATRHGP